ncbi:MAG: aldo/keto reductase, partial [Brevibacterium aurantiacum]|nr:aldo/keto reductase [Brevibacterium aurantiacum]
MSTSEHSSAIPTLELNDGQNIPQVGLGTYAMRDTEGVGAIIAGIDNGYRLLDTAVNYENEREVG